ncbi:hypothetical protein L7F22_014891 [Adiantum nelumboides]|nr:hypothetical protein [Adiantum nelumboides]
MSSTSALMNKLLFPEATSYTKLSSCELPWCPSFPVSRSFRRRPHHQRLSMVKSARAAATVEKRKAFYPGEDKGFVEEMRFVAMKLHRKDQSSEGEKKAEADDKPLAKWEPSITGYIKFLVNSKAVYDILESIVQEAAHPSYEEFRNTGLERAAALAKDLEWFKVQGHEIPEPGDPGLSYSALLKELAEKDPPSFICHFYNVYFAHSAGGRMIGKQVADKVLGGHELEFYKWDGDLKEILAAVKEKLNKVAESWTREEKNRCLQETEKSFKYSGKLLRLIVS